MRSTKYVLLSFLLLACAVSVRADERPSTRTGTFRDFPAFPSTVLGNTRPVMVLLPPSYDSEPERSYPVLYAQDAQNLFDEKGSYIGQEWKLDETLARLWREKRLPEIIVVGVGHTGVNRVREYSPGPSGDRYVRFLATELKPFIDNRFRTKRDAVSTMLMGSSMGGLISLWGLVTRPDVFSGAAALSPSLQLAQPLVDRMQSGARPAVRVYLDIGSVEGASRTGGAEGPTMMDLFNQAVDGLRILGYREGTDFVSRVIPGAEHNEAAWAARLQEPLMYLFAPEKLKGPVSAAS